MSFLFFLLFYFVTEGQGWSGLYNCIKDLFPSLFLCSSNREASVASVLSRSDVATSCEWNISFVRDFNDRELQEVVSFFNFIQPLLPRSVRNDTMVWKLRDSGHFDVRSFYSALQDSNSSSFRGRSFGVSRPHVIFLSSFGQRLVVKSLRVTI